MKTIDLLFNQNINDYSKMNPEYLDDIEINSLKSILLTEEFELFYEVLSKPLINKNYIIERQNIFKDILKNPKLCNNLKVICEEAENNIIPKHIRYCNVSLDKKLEAYLSVIEKSLNIVNELFIEIENKDFSSYTLNNLRNQLKISDEINALKFKFNNLVTQLLNKNISLQIKFGNTFKLIKANIYSSGRVFPKQVRGKLFQKKQDASAASYGYDFIADLQVGNMIESSMKNMLMIINQLNSHILGYCRTLSLHLSFYMIGIKIIKYLQNKEVEVNFPNISDDFIIKTKSLYDIGLVIKKESSNVIPNDFESEKDSFYLISGVNQGGKTTFLKSIGIAQVFAQNGLPVAAQNYSCPIFLGFISHFPKAEDDQIIFLENFKKNLQDLIETFH